MKCKKVLNRCGTFYTNDAVWSRNPCGDLNNNDDGGSPHININSGTAPASPVAVHHKNHLKYCLFALFFGIFGVHNFYAGYYGRGIAQLLLTIAFCAVGEPGAVGAIFIWAIIEMIVINRDADGVLFT